MQSMRKRNSMKFLSKWRSSWNVSEKAFLQSKTYLKENLKYKMKPVIEYVRKQVFFKKAIVFYKIIGYTKLVILM